MGADDLNEEKMDELLRLMRAAVPDTSGMSDAGKVGFVYKFDYDPSASYEKLDVVKFGMSLWTPKGDTTGNPPPDQSQEGQENVQENEHWVLFLPGALGSEYVKKTDLAKAPTETAAGKAGISYPDGKTIFSDENGMLTGATAGKELAQEELEEQIANGDLEAGDVVYLTGKSAGTNGLLIIVDKELNENSVHAIRNSAVTKAVNAANALIAENQRLIAETQALRATLEGFGLGKICPVGVTDVTEDNGMVLGAFEKNASVSGTIGNLISSESGKRKTMLFRHYLQKDEEGQAAGWDWEIGRIYSAAEKITNYSLFQAMVNYQFSNITCSTYVSEESVFFDFWLIGHDKGNGSFYIFSARVFSLNQGNSYKIESAERFAITASGDVSVQKYESGQLINGFKFYGIAKFN